MLTLLAVLTLSQSAQPLYTQPVHTRADHISGARWALGVGAALSEMTTLAALGLAIGARQGYLPMEAGVVLGAFVGLLLSPIFMFMTVGLSAPRRARPPLVSPLINLRPDRTGTGVQFGFATAF